MAPPTSDSGYKEPTRDLVEESQSPKKAFSMKGSGKITSNTEKEELSSSTEMYSKACTKKTNPPDMVSPLKTKVTVRRDGTRAVKLKEKATRKNKMDPHTEVLIRRERRTEKEPSNGMMNPTSQVT